ncbi:hypothetical protein RND71_024183 [Anisodus tanguticus]|uniref:Uncharacterized protein n=1 Tax=Anisodus tanguticus TaxID=243964 RepID=A0AAE1RQ14_9SOLA|nr:hypothetical protein RND71_024183 [Anisodus tanguticus]
MKRKRQIHSHQNTTSKNDFVTLEDWILASPSIEFQGSKQSSNKDYPTLGRLLSYNSTSNVEITYQSNNSCTSEIKGRDQREDNSISQKSGKLKKRVSFRLPEVADVFILDH